MNCATYGLPPCLHIPVAAASVESLEKGLGPVTAHRIGRLGRINAVLVRPRDIPSRTLGVSLWQTPEGARHFERLHPEFQVWVHVDYSGYRQAWLDFHLPDPGTDFLDHVLNRRSIRLLGRAHPYLRLCPVSRRVNTNGGGRSGGEGRQFSFLSNLHTYSAAIQEEVWKTNEPPLRLADPMDLTKMLNLPPGAVTLDGVRDVQPLFYPSGLPKGSFDPAIR